MTNFLSTFTAAVAAAFHVDAMAAEASNFPYGSDLWTELTEDPHFLVLTDGSRVDVMVRGDARDAIYYRPGQAGYAAHKAIAVRQGMLATGIYCPVAWERQELGQLRAAAPRNA